jgi:hypothetical protein
VPTVGTTLTVLAVRRPSARVLKMQNTPDRDRSRSGDLFMMRCPPSLRQALQRASERHLISAAAYVRLALLRRLRDDGIELDEPHAT